LAQEFKIFGWNRRSNFFFYLDCSFCGPLDSAVRGGHTTPPNPSTPLGRNDLAVKCTGHGSSTWHAERRPASPSTCPVLA